MARNLERGVTRDEVEIGVGMKQWRFRVDGDGGDQAIHQPPDYNQVVAVDRFLTWAE